MSGIFDSLMSKWLMTKADAIGSWAFDRGPDLAAVVMVLGSIIIILTGKLHPWIDRIAIVFALVLVWRVIS